MTEKTDIGSTSSAFGVKLDKPIDFPYKWTVYDSIEEIRAANAYPSDDEVVKWRNAQRQNNARTKAQTAKLESLGYQKPTLENDDQLRLKTMFNVLMSSKIYSEEQARELAASNLNLSWDE